MRRVGHNILRLMIGVGTIVAGTIIASNTVHAHDSRPVTIEITDDYLYSQIDLF